MTPNERRNAIGLGGLALIGLGAVMYFEQKPAAPAPVPTPTPTPTPVPVPTPVVRSYQVLGGDTLWAIAGQFYGDPTQYPRIYAANSAVIEQTAQAHGFVNSGGGHWIFPGEMLVIP
jgi:nucleoid-associated protein YgaU